MRNHSCLLGIAFALLATAFLPAARASDMPEVMFILDGSGSMWGEAGAERKIEAAKKVLQEVVPGLPPEVRVGLAAYGHRREKDCEDVEILLAPGSDDRELLLEKALAVTPKGMTPMARSITEVAELLKDKAAETTILLVSDGLETCDSDPCEVVRALKESGIRFVLTVVGFDIKEEEKEQLLCMAEAGGGDYFGPDDSDSLLAALQSVGEELAGKVEAAKTTEVKKSTGLGKLKLGMPESCPISLAGLQITRGEEKSVVKEAELEGAVTFHPLLAGEYDLYLAYANSNYREPTVLTVGPFTIAGGETTNVSLGAIVFNVAEGLVDLNLDGVEVRAGEESLLLLEANGNDYYLFKPKPLPAGTYDVFLHYYRSPAPMKYAASVVVEEGKETILTLDCGVVLEEPEVGGVEGWDLLPAGEGEPLLSVRRGWDNDEPLWRRFLVPPGAYDIHIRLKGMSDPLPAGEAVEIGPGETLRFNTGM